jgi:hypothetical protein
MKKIEELSMPAAHTHGLGNLRDFFPIEPDIQHYWSFAIQTGMAQQNGVVPVVPFGDEFYFVPEGENVTFNLANVGTYDARVYRLQRVTGEYLTAKAVTVMGSTHFSLVYTHDRLGAPGADMQKFVLFSMQGKYRLVMPYFDNSIAYRLPASRTGEIIVSPFSYHELIRPGSIYDQPYMYIIELGLPGIFVDPNKTPV